MAKRQAVAPTAGGPVLPSDLIAFNKQPTDVNDEFMVILPAQTGAITVGSTSVKAIVDIPNVKSMRLPCFMVEMDLTPSFTSTDVKDTFATILPQFVPLIASVINRFTMTARSTTLCDVYGHDLRLQLQYWLRSNAISRLNDLYLYSTNNVAPATQVATRVRFPLTLAENDFPNLRSGFLPIAEMGKLTLDLYFNPAANVMYYSGTAVGTITLGYTVSNLTLKIEDTSSNTIARSLAAAPLNFSYTEWYQQAFFPAPSAQSIVVNLPNNFRFVQAVVAVIRKISDITDLKNGNKLKYYSGDVTPITKANIRFQGNLRYIEPLSGTIDMMHEIKKVLPATQFCDYFQDITTNGTTHNVIALRMGRSISPGVESGMNCSSFNTPPTMELTFTSALGAFNYQIDFFTLHTRYVSIAGGGFSVEE